MYKISMSAYLENLQPTSQTSRANTLESTKDDSQIETMGYSDYLRLLHSVIEPLKRNEEDMIGRNELNKIMTLPFELVDELKSHSIMLSCVKQ